MKNTGVGIRVIELPALQLTPIPKTVAKLPELQSSM
jgi:hypothetical protein